MCCQAGNICSLYPFDSISCVQQIQEIQCSYNYLENQCIKFYYSDYGCMNNLNRNACITQQIDSQKFEARCLFMDKCIQATNLYLKTLGCSANFSKFSCLNVVNQDCVWQAQCQLFNPKNENQSQTSCESYYNQSVLSKQENIIGKQILFYVKCVQKQKKINVFMEELHRIINVQQILENKLSKIECSQKGLNKNGCISIKTKDQTCIFKDNQCQFIDVSFLDSCDYILNKQACLSSKLNNLLCKWTREGYAIKYSYQQIKSYQNEETIVDVNHFVCEKYDGICQYNVETQSCQEVTLSQLKNLFCSTIGLSRQACLLIKNRNCTFYRGFCENLSEEDLNTFNCDMSLNEDACTNILTSFQYCQWNGIYCQRVFLNQVFNCQVTDNQNLKYNGLVCQNISNENAACKYDNNLKQCVPRYSRRLLQFTLFKFCWLLKYIQINELIKYLQELICITKYKQTCQWTNKGCIFVIILPYQTTCEGLGHANPNSVLKQQKIQNLVVITTNIIKNVRRQMNYKIKVNYQLHQIVKTNNQGQIGYFVLVQQNHKQLVDGIQMNVLRYLIQKKFQMQLEQINILLIQ